LIYYVAMVVDENVFIKSQILFVKFMSLKHFCTHTVMSTDNVNIVMIKLFYHTGLKTPLHWATSDGHTDSVSILVASGANVNMKDKVSWCKIADLVNKSHYWLFY